VKDIASGAMAFGNLVKKAESAAIALKILENRNKDLHRAVMKTKEASFGLANEFDMINAVNRAASFGIDLTAESYMKLVKTVTKTAMVMGTNSAQMFNDIVLGSARKSKLILDNLGLVIPRLDVVYKEYAATLGKTAKELTGAEQATSLFVFATKALEERTKDITDEMINMGMTGTKSIKDIETAIKRLNFAFVDKIISAAEKLGILNTEMEHLAVQSRRTTAMNIVTFDAEINRLKKVEKFMLKGEVTVDGYAKAERRHANALSHKNKMIENQVKRQRHLIAIFAEHGRKLQFPINQGRAYSEVLSAVGGDIDKVDKIMGQLWSHETKREKLIQLMLKRTRGEYANLWATMKEISRGILADISPKVTKAAKPACDKACQARRKRYAQDRIKLLKELAEHEWRTWKPETVGEYEDKVKKVQVKIKELRDEYKKLNNARLKESIVGIKIEQEATDKIDALDARLMKQIVHAKIGQKSVTDFYTKRAYDAYIKDKEAGLAALELYNTKELRAIKDFAIREAKEIKYRAEYARRLFIKTKSKLKESAESYAANEKTRLKEETTDVNKVKLMQEQSYWLLKEQIILSSSKRIRKTQLAELKTTLAMEKSFNTMAQTTLRGMHQRLFNNMMDDKKHSTEEFIAQAMIQAGGLLWADGFKNVWLGTAELVSTSGVSGGGTVAVGLGEMAAGATLGYTGKQMMPTEKDDDAKEKAAEDRAGKEIKDQTNVIVHQYENDREYLRNLQRENRRI